MEYGPDKGQGHHARKNRPLDAPQNGLPLPPPCPNRSPRRNADESAKNLLRPSDRNWNMPAVCQFFLMVSQTRSRTSCSFDVFSLPTVRRTQISFAVTMRCGKAKLSRDNVSIDSKSAFRIGIASG
jgi:hypothetical protein